MACMCGDTHCGSCGPAQGNWKCVICGAWADDACEHISEESGKYKSEFQAQADEMYKAEAEADANYWWGLAQAEAEARQQWESGEEN